VGLLKSLVRSIGCGWQNDIDVLIALREVRKLRWFALDPSVFHPLFEQPGQLRPPGGRPVRQKAPYNAALEPAESAITVPTQNGCDKTAL
jgi:hypothetical protein